MTTVAELARGLTAYHLDILERLANDTPMRLASRHQDGLRRTLRQRGLIAHCGKPKRWQITDTGLEVRRYIMEQYL